MKIALLTIAALSLSSFSGISMAAPKSVAKPVDYDGKIKTILETTRKDLESKVNDARKVYEKFRNKAELEKNQIINGTIAKTNTAIDRAIKTIKSIQELKAKQKAKEEGAAKK